MAKTTEENKAAEAEAAAKAAAEAEAAAKAAEATRASGFYVCQGRGLTPPNGDYLRAGDLVPHHLYERETVEALIVNGSIEWQD